MHTPHETTIRVRGYHVDGYRHVNNARYLEFMEEGRWRFSEETGLAPLLAERDLSIIVAKLSIHFCAPAISGDELTLRTTLREIGYSSCQFKQEIFKDGGTKKVTDADVTMAMVSLKAGKLAAIDGKIREKLQSLAQPPESP